MKILHLLASPVWSGPAENVAMLALAQRALGHQVSVAVDRKREELTSEEPAVPRLRELELLDGGGLELSVKSTPLAMLKDVQLLRRRAVDVVHSHFSHDHFVARWGRPPRSRLIRSVHAPRSLRWSLPRADAYTVPSGADLRTLGRPHAIVLPALLSPQFRPAQSRASLRRELSLEGDPLVGMASTFQPSRRHELAVDAFTLLRRERPNARLILIGDGELEPNLRDQVARLGLENAVTFTGYQRGGAFVRWLQALDELWVLGLGNDHSGRIAAQARACEVRVIAVDEGGLVNLADAIVAEKEPAAVLAASLGAHRVTRTLPSNDEIAKEVLRLYSA
jgi:L-malate glycosyltransferase